MSILIILKQAGLGGSALLALGGGILSDTFDAEHRGQAIGLYSLAPLLGPAIGPIAGGFITENTTWRWVFWSTTILCAVVQISGLLFMQGMVGPAAKFSQSNVFLRNLCSNSSPKEGCQATKGDGKHGSLYGVRYSRPQAFLHPRRCADETICFAWDTTNHPSYINVCSLNGVGFAY